MRAIKFRGKDLDTNEWVCGDLLRAIDYDPDTRKGVFTKGYIIHEKGDENTNYVCRSVDIDPNTIGQFTGLIDKNGKEIYEDDIVKIKTLQGIVTWHPNGYFCIHTYKCDISEVSYTAIGDMVDYFHKDLYDDGLEVIGNTFDNPDLMKGGAR